MYILMLFGGMFYTYQLDLLVAVADFQSNCPINF